MPARVALIVAGLAAVLVADDQVVVHKELSRLPVKELTVFKDGHAYVVHEGKRPVDAAGRVRLDSLPTPVLGTFWAYSRDKAADLTAVTAGRHTVRVERTALTVPELIEANPGRQVVVTEGDRQYDATIVGFLVRTSEEVQATSPATATTFPAQRSNLVQLKTLEGVRIVPVEQITNLRFPGDYGTKVPVEEERNLLTLHLDWKGQKAAAEADVGMAYLQRGVRWIPNYRVELDGQGKAKVILQATLINELTDLENATIHLVVGVPTFEFKETIDPLAMGQTLGTLSQYFEQGSSTRYGLSNSIMTQQISRMSEVRRQPQAEQPAAVDLGPDVANTGKAEDLFVFTVNNISLRRGERMVMPVTEQAIAYKDVFVLDIPYAPPREVEPNLNDERQRELKKLLTSPKATHRIRMTNSSRQPLTTAPALLIRDGRVLSQSMMTYTSPGASSDITLTTAVDIKVGKTEKETKRTPNAQQWHGTILQRVDLAGTITLRNLRDTPAEIEVVRHILGNAGEVAPEGKAEMVNALENDEFYARPSWWSWYSWPGWWSHYNGVGRFAWDVTLEKGQSIDLTYTWHHYGP